MQQPSLFFLILHWLVSGLALVVTSKVMPGFKVSSFSRALWVAIVIGLANTFIWPILIFLTLPINILTLGLFTFVVNGIVLKLCAALVKGFEIRGWGTAIFGAIVLSLVGTFLHFLLV